MFSPEFMRYLIMYQGKDFEPKNNTKYIEFKNDEPILGIHRFTKFVTLPIKVER